MTIDPLPDYLHRITIDPQIAAGQPVITGTCILVRMVLERVKAGVTTTELCSQQHFPQLTPEDVAACLLYELHCRL
jgi:uncharacterized protein (DUF433 family)